MTPNTKKKAMKREGQQVQRKITHNTRWKKTNLPPSVKKNRILLFMLIMFTVFIFDFVIMDLEWFQLLIEDFSKYFFWVNEDKTLTNNPIFGVGNSSEGELVGITSLDTKDHVQMLISKSGANITEKRLKKLPKWSDIAKLYGSSPTIIGLETCETFKNQIPEKQRLIGPAGMFNTGTNLMFLFLQKNCNFGEKYDNSIRWQVPWGKHTPESYRLRHVAKAWGEGTNQTEILPIVMIKDPYSWMGSMCRNEYTVEWPREKGHCPNLVSKKDKTIKFPVSVAYNKTHRTHHSSLPGLWNDWYSPYYNNATYPRLIIRYEDLLFHPEAVVKNACTCIGGKLKSKFRYMTRKAKSKEYDDGDSLGFLSAILRYGSETKRNEGYTKNDLKYARSVLSEELMMAFNYIHPK